MVLSDSTSSKRQIALVVTSSIEEAKIAPILRVERRGAVDSPWPERLPRNADELPLPLDKSGHGGNEIFPLPCRPDRKMLAGTKRMATNPKFRTLRLGAHFLKITKPPN